MTLRRPTAAALLLALLASAVLRAEDASQPLGAPVLEPPTLHSLGVYWIIRGDQNQNAVVTLECREEGVPDAVPCLPLLRVERGAHSAGESGSTLSLPDGAWLFAGSALLLTPGTHYELRLSLHDPDGGTHQVQCAARTLTEPVWTSPDWRVLHVAPGAGGGSGSATDPLRGLAAAQRAAKPGTLCLLQPGRYPGTFDVRQSGEPGRPIVWRGPADGSAVLGGPDELGRPAAVGISASGRHDVWFDDLTVRHADYGIVAHDAQRLVVRHCQVRDCEYGFTCTRNTQGQVHGLFLTDNLMVGPSTWPRQKGIENARGIQITGSGHVVAYNRIRGYADAIDTFPSPVCAAIDVHNNELSELTDDGIEMDYSERNTRCFHNRLTNVFQGISLQPVYGGPVYVFRNAIYNVCVETFKLHNGPSGGLFFHNTSVKQGVALTVMTDRPVRNCVMRNNLFLGTADTYVVCFDAPMEGCDFDFDGFAMTGTFDRFLKWNGVRYAAFPDVLATAPVYRHAQCLDAAQLLAAPAASPPDDPAQMWPAADLRLRPDAQAVDAGTPLAGINDRFTGRAPDLGAYECGADLPHYGPRPLFRP